MDRKWDEWEEKSERKEWKTEEMMKNSYLIITDIKNCNHIYLGTMWDAFYQDLCNGFVD